MTTPKARAQEALLPCPFCGQAAIIEKFPSMSIDRHWQVDCSNPDCKCSVSTCALATRNKAIAAWNTRSTPTPDHAALKEARDALWHMNCALAQLNAIAMNNKDALSQKIASEALEKQAAVKRGDK